jgi:hypothetical protein
MPPRGCEFDAAEELDTVPVTLQKEVKKIDSSKYIGRRLKIEKGLQPSSDWLGESGLIL